MKKNPRPSISSPSGSLSTAASVARRSHRQPKPVAGKSSIPSDASISSASTPKAKSPGTAGTSLPTAEGDPNAANKEADTDIPSPWKHPDELEYIRREDWPQDLMLQYLVQKSFSVPPRSNPSNPIIEITTQDGVNVPLPRKYRVPLMFMAKFQWESLRLVLNAANPVTEWQEFRFDIVHISRLCQHLFRQAIAAKEKGGAKGMDRAFRSAMFDRVLTRFYHHWFISRENYLQHFFEEFEEEEYTHDVLKYDWIRWAVKGHKGFHLTKDEIEHGISPESLIRGLGRNVNGELVWTNDLSTITPIFVPNAPINTPPMRPTRDMETVSDATAAENTIEIKRERLESLEKSRKKQAANVPVEEVQTSLPQTIVSDEPAGDTSPAKLAGTKRPREEEEATSISAAIQRPVPVARKSAGVRYLLSSQPTPEFLDKLAQTSSATDATPKEPKGRKVTAPARASSRPKSTDKPLSIKLKPAVLLPPARKRKRLSKTTSGDLPSVATGDDMSQASISAPVGKSQKLTKSPLLATASPTGIINVDASGPSSTADTSHGESVKTSIVIPSLPSISSDVSKGPVVNRSSAALLIPTDPKQNMSYVPSVLDLPADRNMDVSPDLPSGSSPTVTPARIPSIPPLPPATAASSRDSSLVPESVPNGVPAFDFELGPLPAVPNVFRFRSQEPQSRSSTPQNLTHNSAEKTKILTNGSESSSAEPSRHSSVTRNEPWADVAETDASDLATKSRLVSPAVADQLVVEKPLTNGSTPIVHYTSSSGGNDDKAHIEATEKPSVPDTVASGLTVGSQSATPKLPLPSQRVESVPAFSAPINISELIHQLPSGSKVGNNMPGSDPKDDRMVVDNEEPIHNPLPAPSRDRSLTAEHSVGLLMAQDTRAKSLHTILLLRDLLEFLRSPSTTAEQPHQSQDTSSARPFFLDARTRRSILDEEEPITVDQRLDVLAHASVALAKVLYPFRGGELERRIGSLDRRLQQQFDMVWSQEDQLASAMQLQARISSHKETQTQISTLSISRGTQTIEEPSIPTPEPVVESTSQGVQTSVEPDTKEVSISGTQTDDLQEPPPHTTEARESPLSSDITMMDVSSNQPADPTVVPEISKESSSSSDKPRRSEPVAKIMMAIMRNMADLLECSAREDGSVSLSSSKGKEREDDLDDSRIRLNDGYGESPIVSTIINEFKTMKEELRHTEQWSREELRTMSLHHRSEVESLKDQIRLREEQGKDELREMKHRYQTEIEQLKASLRSIEKGKGKQENVDHEANSSLELLELKRRISSLESRSRLDGLGTDASTTHSQSSPAETPSDPSFRLSNLQSHPLAHLMTQDHDSVSSASPHPPKTVYVRESSSKPGTPISADRPSFYANTRLGDGVETEEVIPLPAKSQRKIHMMMFPRAPLG